MMLRHPFPSLAQLSHPPRKLTLFIEAPALSGEFDQVRLIPPYQREGGLLAL